MGEDEEVVEMMKVVNPALGEKGFDHDDWEKGFDHDDWEKWKAIHPTDSPNLDFPNFRTGCTQLIHPHHSSLLPIVMSRVQSVARQPCNACSCYLRLAPIQGFFSSNQANQGGYPGDGDFGGEGDFGGDGRGTFVPPYPTREPNGRDLIVGMTNPDAGGGTIDCFDKNALKNWVGPECWKLRKVIQKHEHTSVVAIGEQTTAAAPRHRREKKGVFKINFYEPLGMSGKELTKEKFAPPTQGVRINLPRHSLPSYSNSGKNRCYKTTPISRVGNRPHYSSSQTSCDGPGFDDGDDDRGGGFAAPEAEGDELDLMATLVGNSRRAATPGVSGGDKGGGSPADPAEPRVLDSVALSLQTTYLKDKMQGVGMSFCFICLNEHGLKTEVGEHPGAEGEAKEITRSEIFGVSRSSEIQTLSPQREGVVSPTGFIKTRLLFGFLFKQSTADGFRRREGSRDLI
ncbi:hypothetical protein BDM02DRAFT_3131995 [Thelephora ganbajun]|uniref:Uncharacterized protein n=1 Tax=Thelephora ganbajun TaxID=370292 RepID=A0ACB6Z2T5_THEGA|nr:hypothetical protein BDM02DRAFT_3131995 [Thelephora ganbajun]